MSETLHKWFLLVGLDDESSDTITLEKNNKLGEDLITIADVHLKLLTNGTVIEPDIKAALLAQMAAELYEKRGKMGVPQSSTIGDQVTIIQNYSDLVRKLIISKKRVFSI